MLHLINTDMWPNQAAFQREHKKDLDDLRDLQGHGYIDGRTGDRYRITPKGLKDIRADVAVRRFLTMSDRMLVILRDVYDEIDDPEQPGRQVPVEELATRTGIGNDVCEAVLYLLMGVSGGQTDKKGRIEATYVGIQILKHSPVRLVVLQEFFNEMEISRPEWVQDYTRCLEHLYLEQECPSGKRA